MNVKIQIDKFKHAEIQFRHKMTIYPSKKFKIAYLYCAQFPFILTKYQNYFLWGLFINVYPTNYPSPWQDLRPPAWWQPRAAPNQIRRSARAIPRLGGGGQEEATYQSSMKWKRFWSLELFFAFVRATAVQLSGIVPSLSMENVITVEMQRSRFCFNSNLGNSWSI